VEDDSQKSWALHRLDADALKPLEPCFGTPIKSAVKAGKLHARLERSGKVGVEIAQALSTTPTRKQQIETALKRCQQKWREGYTDHIET